MSERVAKVPRSPSEAHDLLTRWRSHVCDRAVEFYKDEPSLNAVLKSIMNNTSSVYIRRFPKYVPLSLHLELHNRPTFPNLAILVRVSYPPL